MKNKKKKEYNQISKKELIENDKILIMNRFGFLPSFKKKSNSALDKKYNRINSNVSLSSFKTQKIPKNKNLIQSHSTLTLIKKKEGRNYSQYKPSLTNASTNTNFYSSFFNSKKKLNLNNKTNNNMNKEQNLINSCLWNKLIKNIDQNQNNKINNLKNKNNNLLNNTINTNNSNLTKTNPDNNISKSRIKDIIKLQSSNPVKLTEIKLNNNFDHKSSNYDKDDENKKDNLHNNFNNNNILDEFSNSEKERNNISLKNKNMNINLNNFNNSIIHKNEKFMCKFLSRNNICDISSRDIKEEKSLMKFYYKEKEADYLFISEIEKKNKSIANLNIKKFLNLNDKSLYNILSFQPEIYLELINSNKHIKKRINLCLENIYQTTIDDFKIKHKNIFELVKHKFIQKK